VLHQLFQPETLGCNFLFIIEYLNLRENLGYVNWRYRSLQGTVSYLWNWY